MFEDLAANDRQAVEYRLTHFERSLRKLRRQRGEKAYRLLISAFRDRLAEIEREPQISGEPAA